MADRADTAGSRPGFREFVGLGVIIGSFLSIIALGIAIFCCPDTEAGRMVWSGLLPLLGTWVGTVLVYYFSKEGFQAASESMRKMAETAMGKPLESIPVKDKMIPIEKWFYKDLSVSPAATINLAGLITQMIAANRGQRIPILDKGCPKYVIHASRIYEYLALLAAAPLAAAPGVTPSTATLNDFLNDPKVKGELSNSFALVNENATLADAKDAMEKYDKCQDVFVTKKGVTSEEVIGWITNITIAESAKL
jgi:hypothetical protein